MIGIGLAWVLALYVVFSGKDSIPSLYGLAVLMVGTGVALVLGFMVFLIKDNIQDRRKRLRQPAAPARGEKEQPRRKSQ